MGWGSQWVMSEAVWGLVVWRCGFSSGGLFWVIGNDETTMATKIQEGWYNHTTPHVCVAPTGTHLHTRPP